MHRTVRVVSIAAIAALLMALLATPGPAHAASFAVNSSNDEPDDNPGDGLCRAMPSHQCTLRAAIMEANALPGQDTINVPSMTIQLHIVGSDDQAQLRDLDIRQDLHIVGAHSNRTVIDASRISPGERVFEIHAGLDVRFSGLRVTGGHAQNSGVGGEGEGIRVSQKSELRLQSVVVDGNRASGSDGGISVASGGLVRTHNSTISNNRASGDGGGVAANEGSVWLDEGTVSENAGRNGGGVWFVSGGDLIVISSTISTNTADERGGGFFVDIGPQTVKERRLYLFNATVALNSAPSPGSGGNIFVASVAPKSAEWIVSHSIVASPGSGKNCGGQPLDSFGYNLDSESSCSFNAAGDLSNRDPRLRSLRFDNSETKVHPLPSSSPAVDAVPCFFIWDQRRVSRPRDGNGDGIAICDIGSYELIRPEVPGQVH